MQTLPLSEEFRRRIYDIHGANGEKWLKSLPFLVEQYSLQWNVSPRDVLPHLSYHFLIRVEDHQGNPAILKAGIPGPDLEREVNALRAYEGEGCIRLLKESTKDGIFLLEEVRPGSPLSELSLNGQDEEATLIACDVISRLHTKAAQAKGSESQRTLECFAEGFARVKGPFDAALLNAAAKEYRSLIASTEKSVLLHADLHHFNILKSDRNTSSSPRSHWLAIDPQGVWGDPAFETAAFIRNGIPEGLSGEKLRSLVRQRIDLFSNCLQLDRRRVWGWAFAQTLLASVWKYEDHGQGWEAWYQLAQLIFNELK
jgi:streptomycin 6-kinase